MRFAIPVLIALPFAIGAQTLPANVSSSDWSAIQQADLQAMSATQADTLAELSKLTASDGAPGDSFGEVIAVSGDTAIVGASRKNIGANMQAGSAYVFVRVGDSWIQQQELHPLDVTAYSYFGVSVAINGDTAVIGSLQKPPDYSGAAYVFVRNGTVWTQQQKLTAPDGSFLDHFGGSVSINETEDTAVIGASWKTYPGETGAAYVYQRFGATWSLLQELTGSDVVAGNLFGYSVKINAGNIFVSAPFQKTAITGAVYVFTQNGTGAWSQTQKLTAGDGAGFNFGNMVDQSGDVLIVGSNGSGGVGAAYIFERSSGGWTEKQKLTASNAVYFDYFGWSVAVNGDTIVVGTPRPHGSGSAYVFLRKGNSWIEDQILSAPAADVISPNFFGWTVAVTGKTAIVGAFANNSDTGAAYVFGK